MIELFKCAVLNIYNPTFVSKLDTVLQSYTKRARIVQPLQPIRAIRVLFVTLFFYKWSEEASVPRYLLSDIHYTKNV